MRVVHMVMLDPVFFDGEDVGPTLSAVRGTCDVRPGSAEALSRESFTGAWLSPPVSRSGSPVMEDDTDDEYRGGTGFPKVSVVSGTVVDPSGNCFAPSMEYPFVDVSGLK
ncbi:hypothetical protein VNI00_016992, partial [Paramarasmius palmivorus]